MRQHFLVMYTINGLFLAALLHGIGVGSNHFTHIIIDEAAEFSEPGICVPLCLASKKTTILLAGDNKQTSPRIFSRIAKHHGLAVSLMEVRVANVLREG